MEITEKIEKPQYPRDYAKNVDNHNCLRTVQLQYLLVVVALKMIFVIHQIIFPIMFS